MTGSVSASRNSLHAVCLITPSGSCKPGQILIAGSDLMRMPRGWLVVTTSGNVCWINRLSGFATYSRLSPMKGNDFGRTRRLLACFRRGPSGVSSKRCDMKRSQLEHVLRAAAGITGADEFVVIGSQAILGQFPDPAPDLLVSVEVDVFTWRSPDDATLIDGSIGEGSPFHATFGYYAHGVGAETAVLPDGWKQRLIPIRTPATSGATGWCLEVHDLAVSKLVAGREKDIEYIGALLRHGLAERPVIAARLEATTMDSRLRVLCEERLGRA